MTIEEFKQTDEYLKLRNEAYDKARQFMEEHSRDGDRPKAVEIAGHTDSVFLQAEEFSDFSAVVGSDLTMEICEEVLLDMTRRLCEAEAHTLHEGDLIDLDRDKYANLDDPSFADNERYAQDRDVTKSTFEFEFAELYGEPQRETPTCIVLHTSLTSFACPPTHRVKKFIGDLDL